jgi:protein-S-isoprenylcysteine O-methyltransferase Ste14
MDPVRAPNSIPWPPLIYVGAAAGAVTAGLVAPADEALALVVLSPTAGWIVVALGFALDVWAMATMARAQANILPHRAATALVTHGPFRFSRNPIYLGNTVVLLGLGAASANPWFVPAAIAAALLTQRLAIVREEAHLAALFGDAWTAYAARVRRWL